MDANAAHEAVQDLVRAREAAKNDLLRTQPRRNHEATLHASMSSRAAAGPEDCLPERGAYPHGLAGADAVCKAGELLATNEYEQYLLRLLES